MHYGVNNFPFSYIFNLFIIIFVTSPICHYIFHQIWKSACGAWAMGSFAYKQLLSRIKKLYQPHILKILSLRLCLYFVTVFEQFRLNQQQFRCYIRLNVTLFSSLTLLLCCSLYLIWELLIETKGLNSFFFAKC